MTMVEPINLLLGALLLAFGRKLFWFFVGALGFLVGFNLATRLIPGESDWVLIVIALAAGIAGALLAGFLQRLAIGLAGFLAGGYLALISLELLGLEQGGFAWIPFILGGILGAILTSVLFDWALIVLSSLTGAMLISQALQPQAAPSLLLFAILAIVGILVQASLLRREAPRQAS